jgi:hypothetical protein
MAGHAGRADLVSWLRRSGDSAIVGFDPQLSTRDAAGRWTVVRVQILTTDGRELEYTLRRPTAAQLQELVDVMHASGAISSPNYPLEKLLAAA